MAENLFTLFGKDHHMINLIVAHQTIEGRLKIGEQYKYKDLDLSVLWLM